MSMTANTLELLKKHRLKRKLMRNVSVRTVLMSDHYDSLHEDWGTATTTAMERLVETEQGSAPTNTQNSGSPSPTKRNSISTETPSASTPQRRPTYRKSRSAGDAAALEPEGEKFHASGTPTTSPRKPKKSTPPPKLAPCASDFSPSRRSPRSPARRTREMETDKLPKTILFHDEAHGTALAAPVNLDDTVKISFSNEENLAPEKRSFNPASRRVGATPEADNDGKPSAAEEVAQRAHDTADDVSSEPRVDKQTFRMPSRRIDAVDSSKPCFAIEEARSSSPDSVATPLSVDPPPTLEDEFGGYRNLESKSSRLSFGGKSQYRGIASPVSEPSVVVEVAVSKERPSAGGDARKVGVEDQPRKAASAVTAAPGLSRTTADDLPRKSVASVRSVASPIVRSAATKEVQSKSRGRASVPPPKVATFDADEEPGAPSAVTEAPRKSPARVPAERPGTFDADETPLDPDVVAETPRQKRPARPTQKSPTPPTRSAAFDVDEVPQAPSALLAALTDWAAAPDNRAARKQAKRAVEAHKAKLLADAIKAKRDAKAKEMAAATAKKEAPEKTKLEVSAMSKTDALKTKLAALKAKKEATEKRKETDEKAGRDFEAAKVKKEAAEKKAKDLLAWAREARAKAKHQKKLEESKAAAKETKRLAESRAAPAASSSLADSKAPAEEIKRMEEPKTEAATSTSVKVTPKPEHSPTKEAVADSPEETPKLQCQSSEASPKSAPGTVASLIEKFQTASSPEPKPESASVEQAAATESLPLEQATTVATAAPEPKSTSEAFPAEEQATTAVAAAASKPKSTSEASAAEEQATTAAAAAASKPKSTSEVSLAEKQATTVAAAASEPTSTSEASPAEEGRAPPPKELNATPSPSKNKKAKKESTRRIRFADEVGQPLEETRYAVTQYSEEDLQTLRTIVLLMSPKQRKFEFIHLSYGMGEKTIVGDIIKQIPAFATDTTLAKQTYVGLCRPKESGRELINTVSIQGYFLSRDEVLVAVAREYSAKALLKMAKPLLENKKILRAVKKAKANGLAVQKLKATNNESKNEPMEKRRKELEKKEANAFTSKANKVAPEPRRFSGSSSRRKKSTPIDLDEIEEHDMPNMDMSHMDSSKFMEDDSNKDKMVVTRFLNAGIFAAFAYALGGRSKPTYAH